ALAEANSLADADLIVSGDELTVPLWARPAVAAVANEGTGDSAVGADALSASDAPGEELATIDATGPKSPFTYQVAPGDTVLGLAQKFGLDPDTIAGVNELGDADQIAIGDQLTILPVSGILYTVEPNDTLADIAGRYRIDLGPVIDF